MKKNLMDKYLEKHNATRYQVVKVSAVSSGHLTTIARSPLEGMSVRILRALGMATGQKSHEVLRELEELNRGELAGFEKLLDRYDVSFPELEKELREVLAELGEHGVSVHEFSFNRFNSEEHEDAEADIKQALENTLDFLAERLAEREEGVKLGEDVPHDPRDMF